MYLNYFVGKKARDSDRERIRRLRDGAEPTVNGGNGESPRDPRGDLESLPQVYF